MPDATPIDRPPRMVVVQSEPAQPGAPAWLPVATLIWREEEHRLGVVVKVTLTWADVADGDGSAPIPMRFADDQEPLGETRPSRLPAAGPSELEAPSDFVPRKNGVDVLIVGHAKAREPTNRVQGSVAIAGMRRRFVATAAAKAPAIPLSNAYLSEDPLGLSLAPVHALPFEPGTEHGDDFDFGAYNAAIPVQRASAIAPDEIVDLVGLCRDGDRRWVQLPGVAPRASVEVLGGEREVELTCDTLWLDVDRERCVLTWRGSTPVDRAGHEIARIALWLAPLGEAQSISQLLPALQRGRLGFALRAGEPAELAEPQDEAERQTLQMARYSTWSSKPPQPKLTLKSYAGITAELAEWPDARRETLDRRGMDEDSWTVEERAWLEKMADAALAGDAALADEFSKEFVEAQDALASDAERAQTMEQYAHVKVAMDDATEPGPALGAQKLTISQWLRMDRRWDAAARADPAVADAIERHCAEIRARTAPSAGGT